MEHKSVLLNETIDLLDIKAGGIYVDGTLGRGGHSRLLLERLQGGHLYAFDKDETALQESREVLKDEMDRVTLFHDDFRNMKADLASVGVESVDGIMLDLGVSSPQFDDPERGFSYRFDARLDMRMDRSQKLDAYEVVNTYSYEQLTDIFRRYGEERYAGPIAARIVRERTAAPITTTFRLVELIKASLPDKELRKKGHPAKQVFQALRIEVNDELGALEDCLKDALQLLGHHGRLAVITFHSLEDRVVKNLFRDYSSAPFVEPRLPLRVTQMEQASFLTVTRKPVVAGSEEQSENNRAHSAKLRVIERK